LGVVRATDEHAELAELQRQAPRAARRAGAWICAIPLVGEDMRPEGLVERIENLRRAQFLGSRNRCREIEPEAAHHLLPRDLAVRDAVEVFLERSGEIIFDVSLEEIFEEGGDDASLVGRDEAFLLERDVFALLQHGEDRGIGRRPADAELLHPLDQARLRETRRRLGEVLRDVDALALQGIAGAHRGEATILLVFRLLVAPFLIELEETVEGDDLARGAQIELSRSGLR